ncbi:MAG: extracellular solute-binding protein [Fervidobacterium sp.]
MKKILIWSSVIFAVVVSISLVLFFLGSAEYNKYKTSLERLLVDQKSFTYLDISNSVDFNELKYHDLLSRASTELILETEIPNGETKTISVNTNGGRYYVLLSYKFTKPTTTSGALQLIVNSTKEYQAFIDTFLYYDVKKIYDRYGNEIIPEQHVFNGEIVTFLKDAQRISSNPLVINLQRGNNSFKMTNLKQDIYISKIYFVKVEDVENVPSYAEYIRYTRDTMNYEKNSNEDRKNGIVVLEAEKLFGKSDFLISVGNLQTSDVSPYEPLKKMMNIVDGNTYKQSGQEIHWYFEVNTSGFYKIAFRYQQSLNRGMPVFRRIYIDGRVPFKEFGNYKFSYTGYSWYDTTLSDSSGEPYYVYLDKGRHLLTLEVTTGVFEDTIVFLKDTVKKLQKIGLDLRKLVGNNLDPNRTWDIEKYMPDALKQMKEISNELRDRYQKLLDVVGKSGIPSISDMVVSADLIDKILEKPERLPFFIDEISEGSASIAQRLSELSMRLKEQPMTIDKIYLYKWRLSDYLKPVSSFLVASYEEIYKFWLSLFNKNENYSVYEKVDQEALRVWINRPVQYVETLQYLVDSDFTHKTGIKVILSLMPNEQKLILASSAGKTPDVAMSISNWIPFELAIRNALHPVSEFRDFYDFVSKNINIETLLPMVIDDKVYGITETQNFYVLFYRKDILASLDIPIPDTWDDVKKILPELQRRGMNFFIPMCEQATKYFNTTAPFFFQNEARLYTEDGMKTAINEENSVKAFELMTELFSVYGVPEQVASFYNSFRYGRIPIGIGDFGLYVTLLNAADEIYGLWDIAPSPGVKTLDGRVLRYQVAGDRADVIFANSKKKNEAWSFLKWWLSRDTQVKFSRMLVNRYGSTYLWNTANIQAFNELDFFSEREKKVILEQWSWIREVQRHPGGYMTEREISNIWNRVVVEGYPLRASIDRSVITINRELERKLTEFGYIKLGKPVKSFRMYKDMKEFLIKNLGEEANVYLENQKTLWGDSHGY